MELEAPRGAAHLEALADLFAATFGDYWDWYDVGANSYLTKSPYDWESSRVGVENGEVVTHFGVWDFQMRIGTARVRLAGIGAVATARAHRRRGLMHETASACLDGLGTAGYDMSLLFGIPDFYQRYGYVSTFSENITVLDAATLKPLEPAVRFTSYEGENASSMERFAGQYNAENETVTGTFVRPTFRANPRRKHWRCYTFSGGYIVAGKRHGNLEVVDCAGPPESVIDVARQLAQRDYTPEIHFVFLPRRSRVGEYLFSVNHRYVMRHAPDGAAMIKIVNLQSTVRKLIPELQLRLAASPLADYSGRLRLCCEHDCVTLVVSKGVLAEPTSGDRSNGDADRGERVDGEIRAGAALARLVIGDDEPQRICRLSGTELEGDAQHLVPILFPGQEPSTILWDRF